MPVEAWFGTPIYSEQVPLSDETRALTLQAITDVLPVGWEELRRQRDAYTTRTTEILHLDERVAPLFRSIRPAIHHFVYEELGCDPEMTQVFVGRCRPVIQSPGGSGNFHAHGGAMISGVFFLMAPEGAGGIEFMKAGRSTLDHLPTARSKSHSFNTVRYEAKQDRLLLFASDLFHRATRSEAAEGELRIVIAFDLFAFTDLRVGHSGPPLLEQLKRLD